MNATFTEQFDTELCNPTMLKDYVSHVLAETSTNKYPPQVALEMMNQAWEAQQMLWHLEN